MTQTYTAGRSNIPEVTHVAQEAVNVILDKWTKRSSTFTTQMIDASAINSLSAQVVVERLEILAEIVEIVLEK